MELAQDELAKAAAEDAQIISYENPAYPAELKQIYDPPLILFVRGNVAALAQPGIALVGTGIPPLTGLAWRNVWLVILRPGDW